MKSIINFALFHINLTQCRSVPTSVNWFWVSLLMSAVLPILASPTTTTEHSILAAIVSM